MVPPTGRAYVAGPSFLGGLVTYLDYLKSVLSWHYFVEAGEIFQAAVAKPIDDLVLAAKTAVVQRFWRFCEDDALPWLLQNYNLDHVEAFKEPE